MALVLMESCVSLLILPATHSFQPTPPVVCCNQAGLQKEASSVGVGTILCCMSLGKLRALSMTSALLFGRLWDCSVFLPQNPKQHDIERMGARVLPGMQVFTCGNLHAAAKFWAAAAIRTLTMNVSMQEPDQCLQNWGPGLLQSWL